jgi:hypothetical protein
MRSPEQHLADMQRQRELVHATSEVTKFEHTLARLFAKEHPDHAVVQGYRSAESRLAALTDGGVVRGHLRLIESMGADQ